MMMSQGERPNPEAPVARRNFLWNSGMISAVLIVFMIATGLFLAFNYVPSADKAFASVGHIMRDVRGGRLLHYMHANGASMLFAVVYLHIFRGIYHRSYKAPRRSVWLYGVGIYLAMMATAFTGYVLPWGQMSYWGATVIVNMFAALPLVGEALANWLRGGADVDSLAVYRFFVLHLVFTALLLGVVFLHVAALRAHSGDVEPKPTRVAVPFHPYYTVRDFFGLIVVLSLYAAFVFFAPDALGHAENYIPANPLVTPEALMPEWYFMPFYTILRAVTVDLPLPFTSLTLISSTLGGAILMFGSVAVLLALPWLDCSPARAASPRPAFRVFFGLLVLDCLALGLIGAMPVVEPYITIGQAATGYYFLHFLVLMPLLVQYEKKRPLLGINTNGPMK